MMKALKIIMERLMEQFCQLIDMDNAKSAYEFDGDDDYIPTPSTFLLME